jgi:hypothetical protein
MLYFEVDLSCKGQPKIKKPGSHLLSEEEAIGQGAENKSSEEGVFPIALRQCKAEHGDQNTLRKE